MAIEDNSFDLFVTQDVMEHIFNPDLAFKEIYRVLKPGGAHILWKTVRGYFKFMSENSPVFIVGSSRSGTSLLYRMLQKHPVFKPQNCPAGVDLTETKIFVSPATIYNKEKAQGVGGFAYLLSNDLSFDKFVNELGWIVHWQDLLGTSFLPGEYNRFTRFLIEHSALRLFFWNLYAWPATARSFFETAKEVRGVERILEKTPTHLHRIPEIRNTYPDSKILGIVRHPIDTFTSYRRRFELEKSNGASSDQLNWLDISPESFCTRYAVEWDIVQRENCKSGRGFMYVRYESLTREPDKTLQDILTFVGEEYDEQCVVTNETNQAFWEVDPYLFDKIQLKTKNFRNYIEPKDADYIQTTLELPMQQLGYERYL